MMYGCKKQTTQGNKKTMYTYNVLIGLFVCGGNLLLQIRLLLLTVADKSFIFCTHFER